MLYATKANPEPAIIRVALSEGAMVDAVTLGHMRLIERAGGRPEQIVFNGNSKTEAELRHALDGRIAMINVDSLAEMQLIAELVPPAGGDHRQPVCLRVAFDNTRVAGDDAELAGYEHLGKFGMDPADLLAAAEIARGHPGIELAGLHNHIGYPGYGQTYSPTLDLQRHVAYLTQTLEVARTLRDHGDVLRILNVGGGYRVGNPAGFGPGRPTESPTADQYAEAIAGCARDLCAEWGLGSPELMLEAALSGLRRRHPDRSFGRVEDAPCRNRTPALDVPRGHLELPLRASYHVRISSPGAGGQPDARPARRAGLDLRPGLH